MPSRERRTGSDPSTSLGEELTLTPRNAYVLVNKVTHARFQPKPSSHQFSYPTISFLFSLSALEHGLLDMGPRGSLFSYGATSWRLTGLRPSAYLHSSVLAGTSDNRTIIAKLQEVLDNFGRDSSLLSDAWIMTMPSYFGFEGINPLTVYFCYKSDRSLWLVVLEVSLP